MAREEKLHTMIPIPYRTTITPSSKVNRTSSNSYKCTCCSSSTNRSIHSTNDGQCKAIVHVAVCSENKMVNEVKLHTTPYCIEQQKQLRVRSTAHVAIATTELSVRPAPTRHPLCSIHSINEDQYKAIVNVAKFLERNMENERSKITYYPSLHRKSTTGLSAANCTRSNSYNRTSCLSRPNTAPVSYIQPTKINARPLLTMLRCVHMAHEVKLHADPYCIEQQ